MSDLNQMTEFQQRAAAAGLHKLLHGENFYTSTLREIAKTMGRELGGRDWDAMAPLHCVRWADMDPVLRQMMREKCLELLGLPTETLDAIEPERREEARPAPAPVKAPRLAWWRTT